MIVKNTNQKLNFAPYLKLYNYKNEMKAENGCINTKTQFTWALVS